MNTAVLAFRRIMLSQRRREGMFTEILLFSFWFLFVFEAGSHYAALSGCPRTMQTRVGLEFTEIQ